MPQWRLMEHLALAEEQLALDAKNVARQREIIAQLEQDGRDATQAWALLTELEQLQAMHGADRNRLLGQLQEQR